MSGKRVTVDMVKTQLDALGVAPNQYHLTTVGDTTPGARHRLCFDPKTVAFQRGLPAQIEAHKLDYILGFLGGDSV
jgi:hypothetical protein